MSGICKRKYPSTMAAWLLCLGLCIGLSGCSAKEAAPAGDRPAPSAAVSAKAEEAQPLAAVNEEPSGLLIISELMEKNRATLMDEDGSFPDWIEIYNPGTEAVSLADWSLADSPDERPWEFPNMSIAGGERIVVFASNKNRAGQELHTDFALSEAESVYLRDSKGSLVYKADCGGCDADWSMCLDENGDWVQCIYPTPGFENSEQGYEQFQQLLFPQGPLVINEAMPLNMARFHAAEHGYCDWLELKNISYEDINLSDYYLSTDSDEPKRFRLPDRTVAPGACFVLLCNNSDDLRGSFACASFDLDSDNEQIFLSNAVRVVDCISLKNIPYECSYGRVEAESGYFYFTYPSPGDLNLDGYRLVAPTPVSKTEDGVFEGVDSITVELSGTDSVRYTLDGSAPTMDSPEYTGPFEIEKTTVVRATNFRPGAVPSRPLTLSFFINEGIDLPIVSLVSDKPHEFRATYDAGQKDVELPGNVALYREGEKFSIGCGLSMNGETSLSLYKKNIAMRFRGTYGQGELKHDIFGGGVTEFTNLVLRAGQDQEYAMLRNELGQRMCELANAKVINQRSIFCALFVNGEFRGLYTLKEKCNEQLYASLAGVKKKSVTVLKAPVPFDSGLSQDVIQFVLNNDMTKKKNYEHFCSLMDVDSLIDWLIMEGYCANTDVTLGNVRYCRSDENDGKWRLMFYDLDATFNNIRSMYHTLMSEYGYENFQVSAIVFPLMQNADFRDSFLTRLASLLTDTLTNEALLKELDAMESLIESTVQREFVNYTRTVDDWHRDVEHIRSLVRDGNWRQCNIDAACEVFELSEAERSHYFGAIDGK